MFANKENIELIWGLLKDQTNIPLTGEWRSFFDKTVNHINSKANQYNDVVEMNKHLIAIFMEKYETTIKSNWQRQPTVKKMDQIKLKKRQDALKQMKDGIKPDRIDFHDKTNDSYENVTNLMDQTMAARQKEMETFASNFAKHKSEATRWLNVDDTEKVPEIKIDMNSSVEIKNQVIPTTKKVKFNLDNISNVSAKINYTENGVNKNLICSLSKGFRLFTSVKTRNHKDSNVLLENIELFVD
tara:strand:- start:12 stop:737 length:726 start_codon:yes stop_codon:yes gene_type:complete